jgi:cation-transporting ATPase E
MTTATLTGLTQSQVKERLDKGQSNAVELSTSRSLKDIIIANVFNPVNIVLYAIGFGLIAVGDTKSALGTVGIVIFNAVVGIVQEVRAKQQLDKIALLARAKVMVLRDGREQQVDPGEVVLGDVLVVRAGDQIPVDGIVISDSKIEVDESALTGESDLVAKTTGEEVLSGSFCVTGETMIEANGSARAALPTSSLKTPVNLNWI